MSPNWELSEVFLMVRLWLWVWGRKITEWSALLNIYQDYRLATRLITTVVVDLDHLTKVICQVSPLKSDSLPPPPSLFLLPSGRNYVLF